MAYSTGISAGERAVEHLAGIVIESGAVPLRNSVLIPFVESAFDDHDRSKDPMADIATGVMIDDLAWWSALLEKGRAQCELPPGTVRRMAAARKMAVRAEAG